MGYCHCGICRSWSGAPLTAISLWKADGVKITSGGEHLRTFQATELAERQFCALCGGHVMARIPSIGMVDVFGPTLPTLEFEPSVHIYYGDKVLPIRDGLPKLKDITARSGGSGEVIAE